MERKKELDGSLRLIFLDSHWTGPGLLDSYRILILGQMLTFWVQNLPFCKMTIEFRSILFGEGKNMFNNSKHTIFARILISAGKELQDTAESLSLLVAFMQYLMKCQISKC